jgi:hypothetical protein
MMKKEQRTTFSGIEENAQIKRPGDRAFFAIPCSAYTQQFV